VLVLPAHPDHLLPRCGAAIVAAVVSLPPHSLPSHSPSNNLRNDIIHPNEYVRGSTLRFLAKVKEPEILESLVPAIRTNLEHRHSYVRRNAVACVYSIVRTLPELIPDGGDLIEEFLAQETDPSSRRNAFLMLFHVDVDRAIKFLNTVMADISTYGDVLQLTVLELVRRLVRVNPSSKSRYIRIVHALLTGASAAVRYEAARTLVSLSTSAPAVRAAAAAYIEILVKESDNNVKLIVLDRYAASPATLPPRVLV
jgi:coatomer subunit beta